MSPTVSHKDSSRQRRPGTFNHSLDLKSGPLPPGSWDDNLPEVVGGEGDKVCMRAEERGKGHRKDEIQGGEKVEDGKGSREKERK